MRSHQARPIPRAVIFITVGAITVAHVIGALIYTFAFIWGVQGLQIVDLKPS